MRSLTFSAALAVVASGLGSCPLAIDMVLVQDLSASMADDLVNLKFAATVFDMIKTDNPGSRMGVTSFVDHSVEPFGVLEDDCVTLQQPITDDSVLVTAAIGQMTTGDGGDEKQSQLLGIQQALLNPSIGWHPNGSTRADGAPILKIVLLVTDSPYHVAGEAAGFIPNTGSGEIACGFEDYPSLPQIASAFEEREAYFVGLISGSGNLPVYNDLIRKTMGTDRGMTAELAGDSGNIGIAMFISLSAIADNYCSAHARPTATTTTTTTTTSTTTMTTIPTGSRTTTTTTTSTTTPTGSSTTTTTSTTTPTGSRTTIPAHQPAGFSPRCVPGRPPATQHDVSVPGRLPATQHDVSVPGRLPATQDDVNLATHSVEMFLTFWTRIARHRGHLSWDPHDRGPMIC
eukprot:Polyplicarium_translucidae@DN3354_c5_g2_i11.p1